MAVNQGSPNWVLDCKEHVAKSKEWKSFVEELYDALEQQLKENHVQTFSSLSAAEQNLLMGKALQSIQSGKVHADMYRKVSVSLDQHLNNDVARQLMEEYPLNTKSDLVLGNARDGAVSLLKKWPDMKSKLHVCFGQPLADGMRQTAWKLFLSNANVRRQYVDTLKSDPRLAISGEDDRISRECERLLETEPTFQTLKGSVGAFYAMKALLSYYHTLLWKKVQESLPHNAYMLNVPFLFVVSSHLPRQSPVQSSVMASLVEEYVTFMDYRPLYMQGRQATNENGNYQEALKGFANRTFQCLNNSDAYVNHIVNEAYAPPTDGGSAESVSENESSDPMMTTVGPIIQNMFVGYVNPEVLLFIWDQYIIGMDVPEFKDEYLPAVMATFLVLLKEKVRNCQSGQALNSTLKSEGVKLTVPQFQFEINKNFYKNLYQKLNGKSPTALDPTQAHAPLWHHWFNENIPSRTTSQMRRSAREERELQRLALLKRQREQQEKTETEKDHGEDDYNFKLLLDEVKRRNDEEMARLEAELERERQKRREGEWAATDEVERLKKQIEELKRPPSAVAPRPSSTLRPQTPAYIVGNYLLPRPPTAASLAAVPVERPPTAKMPPSAPHTPAGKRAENVLKDFLQRVSYSFNKVAHGTDYLRDELNDNTKESIITHKDDLKKAEIEVFGRQLKQDEFAAMSPQEQEAVSEKIMDVIRTRMRRRRQEQVEKGQM